MDTEAEPIRSARARSKRSSGPSRSVSSKAVDPQTHGQRLAAGNSERRKTSINANRSAHAEADGPIETAKTKTFRKILSDSPSDFAPLILSPLKKETFDMSRPEKFDTSKLAADSSQVAEDIAKLARAAIDAIRAATDEFASKAGVSKSEAVDAVRNASQAAVTGIGSVAGEARAMTETGLDTLGKSVIRNPLAALAIAAGTGLLLGLLSRSGQDTRR